MDGQKTDKLTRMVFIFKLRLAFASMNTWKEIEALIYETCSKYPVSYHHLVWLMMYVNNGF